MPLEQAQRIAALQSRYHVRFESQLSVQTSLNNYEYLDILDQAWTGAGLMRPENVVACDVGCASFWYASALSAFFRPRTLTGVDVEGHRLFKDGHTRIDYALGYTGALPDTHFVIADYLRMEHPAQIITAWFPFLTPVAILAWRLPLSLLRPGKLMARIHHNLSPGGLFVMINHGVEEAGLGGQLCIAADLENVWQGAPSSPLSRDRGMSPVVSVWRRCSPLEPQ